MDLDDDLIDSIAPDVLKVLASKGFFEALDDQLCPSDSAQPPLFCGGTFGISTEILSSYGFGPEEIAEITHVLESRGACCDCEILFNVAEECRLKSRYWKARSAASTSADSHGRNLDV
jgi:hypothetical protein